MLAGYSGTPLLKKLGVKVGAAVRLFDAPAGFAEWMEKESEGVQWTDEEGLADVIVLFAEWEANLVEHLQQAIPGIKMNGGLWVAWPKKASKVLTDITEDRLRDILLPQGLVDNKVCAIDDTWSGLRFVWRVENRNKL